MSANPISQIVTANALATGDVVYLTGGNDWSVEIVNAEFIADDDQATRRLSEAEQQAQIVIDAHLAKVEITDNGPVPLTRREALRASGPSIAFGAAALVPAAIAAE